jgi:hypothetical protein
MVRIPTMIVTIFAVIISAPACAQNAPTSGNVATDLAANVVDIAVEALAKDDGSPKWQELDRRLSKLFGNKTKDGDEAVVILMSFYIGESTAEELHENLLSRGPRMIPLLERYLREEPVSLLKKYPARVRLERTTTISFLNEDLEILRVRAGSRHIASTSVETAPLRHQVGECTVKLVQHPKFEFDANLVQTGESYHGAPVLRADIEENGNLSNMQLLSRSGIRRLDGVLLKDQSEWKYAPRPRCGMVQANIVISIDWLPPSPAK